MPAGLAPAARAFSISSSTWAGVSRPRTRITSVPSVASAAPWAANEANVGSASSMTWVCSLMITDAMSSVMPKN